MKAHYRYEFRGLADPPELEVKEAGPFTPDEAFVWGQVQACNRTLEKGRPWVCHYEALKPPDRSRLIGKWVSVLLGILLGLLVWRFLR